MVQVKAMFENLAPFMSFPMRLIFSNLWFFGPLIVRLMPVLNKQAGAMVGTTISFNEIESGSSEVGEKTCKAESLVRCINEDDLKNDVDELKKIAKKIIEFNFEMHNSDIHWDRKSSIYNANKKIEKSLLLLQEYLKIDEINSLQEFSIKFNTYLNSKQHFCITHGDLWAENLIVNQKNELIGIIDFESMTYFLPEVDYASFWNMKDGFLDLLLEYSNEDVTIESVALFVLYREVSSFPYIMHDGEEEIECQIQKIRDALKFNESKKKKNKMI